VHRAILTKFAANGLDEAVGLLQLSELSRAQSARAKALASTSWMRTELAHVGWGRKRGADCEKKKTIVATYVYERRSNHT
jgi:hypothetical protein